MALIAKLFGQLTPEEVVSENSAHVLAQLRRIFGPRADVDDVFQAVFVEVLRSLPAFRGRSKIKTWIHRITMNVAYQEMRMQYRERATASIDDVEEPAADGDVEEALATSEEMLLLYRALETLDPKKRMALVLHDIEGMTLKEIGEHLGKPLQTVASQVKSGREELAQRLAAAGMKRGRALRVADDGGEASGR